MTITLFPYRNITSSVSRDAITNQNQDEFSSSNHLPFTTPLQSLRTKNGTHGRTLTSSAGNHSLIDNGNPWDKKEREFLVLIPSAQDHDKFHSTTNDRSNVTGNSKPDPRTMGWRTRSQPAEYEKGKANQKTRNSPEASNRQIKSTETRPNGNLVRGVPTNQLRNIKKCTPVKNIVFLKTHKCATTTLQNILFRYGDKHQLRFVLPRSKTDHRFSLRYPFDRRQVLTTGRGIPGRGAKNRETFNIFTNHAIFNREGEYCVYVRKLSLQ